ncbi:hypothetical protein JOF49_000665 [Corynebacterium suicordis]|nr:hypothetical protein [Corynebacterium suicordis]
MCFLGTNVIIDNCRLEITLMSLIYENHVYVRILNFT